MPTFATLWPICWQQPVESLEASMGMQAAATVLADLSPTAQLTVAVQCGGSEPLQAWVGLTNSERDDGSMAGVFKSALQSLVPWLGLDFDSPQSTLPHVGATHGMAFQLETRESDRSTPAPKQSSLMSVISKSEQRWQLTMSSGMRLAESSGDELDFSISLIGGGPEISIAPSLLELDAIATGPLPKVIAHRRSGSQLSDLIAMARRAQAPLAGLTDGTIVGRLMSIPLRLDADWPYVASKPAGSEDVLEVFDSSTPPHVLVVGGSGQGKTTTLLNAAVRSAKSGNTPVIVDPHGDLARRVAAIFESEGIAYSVLDFGARNPLAWNLTEPPLGVDLGTWVNILTAMIRDLWPDLGSEYIGPVWIRVVRALISILVLDPIGPHPLTVFPELMSADSSFRGEAVERIGDAELARIVKDEVEPMLNQRDPGNTVMWITSKLEPIVGDPTVRAIIERYQSDVDLSGAIDGTPLIVSVPTTHLTDSAARLLAGTVLSHLWLLVRRNRPNRDIDLFLDEWHRIPSPALPPLLAEGRKFGIHLRLSNQNASQIARPLWDTALANTGGIVVFRTGPSDARYLDSLFPSIHADSLSRLPRHWVAVTTGDTDFTAPAPAPIGHDDGGDALERGHKRAVARIRTTRAKDQEVHQLRIEMPSEAGEPPPSERDEDEVLYDPAKWIASLAGTRSRPSTEID